MNREEYVAHCLSLPNAAVDNPFDINPSRPPIFILRHADNLKWFAAVMERDEKIFVNLKCDPPYGEYLRENETGVYTAYHMNKRHWVSVFLDEISDDLLKELTNLSYWLTAAKNNAKRK